MKCLGISVSQKKIELIEAFNCFYIILQNLIKLAQRPNFKISCNTNFHHPMIHSSPMINRGSVTLFFLSRSGQIKFSFTNLINNLAYLLQFGMTKRNIRNFGNDFSQQKCTLCIPKETFATSFPYGFPFLEGREHFHHPLMSPTIHDKSWFPRKVKISIWPLSWSYVPTHLTNQRRKFVFVNVAMLQRADGRKEQQTDMLKSIFFASWVVVHIFFTLRVFKIVGNLHQIYKPSVLCTSPNIIQSQLNNLAYFAI